MGAKAGFLLLLLAAVGPAGAAEPASYHYRIHHQIFGDIGEHWTTVSGGDPVVVEHRAELAIEILGVQAFHRKSRYREVWQDAHLIEFDGLTEDDGVPFVVRAWAEGDRLIVDGAAGRIEAPVTTAPSAPSLVRGIERDRFFDIKTGALLEATVTAGGREPLKLVDGVVEADRYEVAGELEQHVWFDAAGVWVQWRLWRQGAAITLARD
jgi:hypothetical protein